MQALLDAVPAARRDEVIDVLEVLEKATRASDPRHA
jgi:hypothetical protein